MSCPPRKFTNSFGSGFEPTTMLRIDRPLLEELLADRPALAHGIIAALVAMVRERARSEADTTTP